MEPVVWTRWQTFGYGVKTAQVKVKDQIMQSRCKRGIVLSLVNTHNSIKGEGNVNVRMYIIVNPLQIPPVPLHLTQLPNFVISQMQLKINLKEKKKRFTILLEWWACMCEVLSLQDFHLQQITYKQNHKPEMLTKIVYILCYVWRGFFTCSRWHHSEASKCIFVCKSHLGICIKELAICCSQHYFKIFPTLKWCVIILLVTHVGWLFSHMKTCHTRKGLGVNVWKGWQEFSLDLSVNQGRSLFTQKNCVCCLCCICISHALRNKMYHEKFPRMLLQINNFLGNFKTCLLFCVTHLLVVTHFVYHCISLYQVVC